MRRLQVLSVPAIAPLSDSCRVSRDEVERREIVVSTVVHVQPKVVYHLSPLPSRSFTHSSLLLPHTKPTKPTEKNSNKQLSTSLPLFQLNFPSFELQPRSHPAIGFELPVTHQTAFTSRRRPQPAHFNLDSHPTDFWSAHEVARKEGPHHISDCKNNSLLACRYRYRPLIQQESLESPITNTPTTLAPSPSPPHAMPSAMPPPKSVANTAIADTRRTSTAWSPQGEFMFPASRTRPSSKVNGVGVQVEDTRICVVMVGLPARGKSLIAQKGMLQSSKGVHSLKNSPLIPISQLSGIWAGSRSPRNASMSETTAALILRNRQQTSSTRTTKRASDFAELPLRLPSPTC